MLIYVNYLNLWFYKPAQRIVLKLLSVLQRKIAKGLELLKAKALYLSHKFYQLV